VERVGVVGCGVMGSGIATVCALAGVDTVVVEADPEAAEAGRRRVEDSLRRTARSRKLDEAALDAAMQRVRSSTELEELSDRSLVIEAVVESELEKIELFHQLDKILPNRDVVLASNTSSLPITKLAISTACPERVIGMHFFNPPSVLRLMELVPSLLTNEETIRRAEAFAVEELDRHVVRSKDHAGFIVNTLLCPYILSAIRMLDSGFATKEDIDAGMVHGCAHPLGPLALADLMGLDTTAAIARSLYEEFREPMYAPPPLLMRMVEAGLLGRKRGRGFYEYPTTGPRS
jgi:3-hydroxybutyryl-CoA dehydrogenase